MSNQQIQKCIRDIIQLNEKHDQDWTQGPLKKLLSATSTLYNTSINKVMLKQDEELARYHICAFIAAERLYQKTKDSAFEYSMNNIPLEPKKVRNLLNVFKSNIFQTSPVKNFHWSPSPKKSAGKKSPLKENDRFSSRDPNELRKELFGTPTKISPSKSLSPVKLSPGNLNTDSPIKARRKLAFEDSQSDSEQDEDSHIGSPERPTENPTKESTLDTSTNTPTKSPIKRRRRTKGPFSGGKVSLLHKKYYKVTPTELITLCNEFELPQTVAYGILDEYVAKSTYLTCPWQLVCGLVMNCVFIVFNDKRRNDPRIDHLLIDKMRRLMKSDGFSDVNLCVKIVKELITGEQWFRDLQVKYNYFNGVNYDEQIAVKFGSMLQSDNNLVSREQYANWYKKIEQDLSLRGD